MGLLRRRQVVLSQVSHARTAGEGKDGTEDAAWSSMAVHSSDVPEYAYPVPLYRRMLEPCAGMMLVEAAAEC